MKDKKNIYVEELIEDYIEYISELNMSKKSSSKSFYIVIENDNISKNENSYEIIVGELKEKFFKIKECLSRCGNEVTELNTKKDILEILFSFLNTRKYLNFENNDE